MQSKGLTLLELLVTLSIASILLAIAAPSFADWITQNRLRTSAYDLLTDIHKTRNEAVSRVSRVSLWNVDGDWDTGWQMFVDDNANGDLDTGEQLLFERTAMATGIDINGDSSVAGMISYAASGHSLTTTGAFQAGILTLCGDGADKAYQIVISRGGRARMVAVTSDSSVCP